MVASGREWSRIFDSKIFQVFEPQTAKLREPYVDVFALSSTRSSWAAEHFPAEHFPSLRPGKSEANLHISLRYFGHDWWGTFEDQTAQLVLNSLYDWKPVQLITNDVRNAIIFTSF